MDSRALKRPPAELHRPLMLLACALLVSCLLLAYALHARDAAQQQHHRVAAAMQQAQQRLARAQDAATLAEQDLAAFQSLQVAGLFREHAELAWRQALAQLRSTGQQPDFRYRLDEQEAPLGNRTPPFLLQGTAMQIDTEVRHSLHLFKLLAALQTLPDGRFVTSGCRVQRDATLPPPLGLRATCHGHWLTFREISP